MALSSSGRSIKSQVAPRFGRCQFFLLVESETLDYEVIPNDALNSAHGAGVAAATLIASKGVEVVLTGNIGPNAYNALSASRIKVVTGVTGIAENAVTKFLMGGYKTTEKPTVRGHFGQGKGREVDRGGSRRMRV